MKFTAACTVLLFGSAAGFAAKTRTKSSPSEALPWTNAPDTLDGSMIGDAGFDPLGLSYTRVSGLFDKDNKGDTMSDLNWLREAEITHGRIAQLAVLGFIVPALVGTFPGNDWTGVDAYSNTNGLQAVTQVPIFAWTQILAFMSWVEFNRVQLIKKQGSKRMPGDLNLGQGEGRFNPFNLNYSPEQYEKLRLNELKHCRLAMLGATGLAAQCFNSGTDVVTQIGTALEAPEYASKAGYFFPEGI